MNIERNRGVTMSMSKRLFTSIAFQKEIDMELKGTTYVVKSDEKRIKTLDFLIQKYTTPELVQKKSKDVIDYLNSTIGVITPIKKIIIEN